MATIHGFDLIREDDVPELNIHVKLYRHAATGAELLSVETDDENKTFGITFRTPPPDSTGVPHILEHAVLGGSRKYPVKEPFVELLKGSLQTFLNAMTYPDKTCYPVASQNLKDFYNLVDVYLDGVFYPRITAETFQQEGWHYELEDLSDPLIYKGVVFSEMKGRYSSPDALIYRYSEQSLFPDTAYGLDGGGDPEAIPTLTYDQFRAFHQRYYHPSNAKIFFYGDDAPEERLRFVQQYLKDFVAISVDSAVSLQSSFSEPRRVTRPYPSGEDAENQKAMLTVNWLLAENMDPRSTFSLQMLAYILLGTSASPLRKALIDSGLGEDVTGAGLDDNLRQLYFSTGLKGIAPENVDQVELLILDTLAALSEQGIERDTVEAAINTIEFSLREQNFGSYPRGLVLMVNALSTWLHDGDPLAPLAFEAPLSAIKEQFASGARYFEDLIADHLLENPHRVTVVLTPDPELQRLQEAAERERLAEVRQGLSQAELQTVISDTQKLKLLQATPDLPEALATIPSLGLEDLDKESKRVPTELSELDGTEVLYHDLFTNGIVYVDVGFNMHVLSQDLLPYLPLFSAALLEIGTETEDFVKLIQRIGRKTGGIHPASFTSSVKGSPRSAAWLFLRGKATMEQTDDLLDILRDILLTVKLDNQERFVQMLLEHRAGMEASLAPAGHRLALSRLRAKFSEAGWAAEQMGGVSQLFFLRQLAYQAQEDWPAVLAKLEEVRTQLVNRNAAICNVTLDQENWTTLQPKLASFLATLPAAPLTTARWVPDETTGVPEGLTIPAKVNYVAKGANLYDLGYELDGSSAVISPYLRSTYLWERVRVQGGAYGAYCILNQHSGLLAYASYMDPNLLGTLDVFDQTGQYLRELALSDDELTKGIIGAIGGIDAYQLPDAKGYSALQRYLVGYTDERRQALRDEVLSTTAADFRAFADVLDGLQKTGLIVVVGSQEALADANAERGGMFAISKVL